MRYFELIENRTSVYFKNLGEIVEILQRDCSEYLNSRPTGKFLWRGMTEQLKFAKGATRVGRTPLGTETFMFDLYNDYLQSIGIEARRDNSLLTSPIVEHANKFGKTYAIFPINGFNWSSQKSIDVGSDSKWDIIPQINYEKIESKFGLTKEDIKFNATIYDVYYMLDDINAFSDRATRDEKIMSIMDRDKTIAAIAHIFEPFNTDISRAMNNNFETLILGEYYALEANLAMSIINHNLAVEPDEIY